VRRFSVGLLAFTALTATFQVLPVYAAPGPEPEPVETSADVVDMGSVEEPAPAADVQAGTTDPVDGVPAAAPTLTVRRADTDDFSLVGVTWAYDTAVTDTVVQVRVQDAAGSWGKWTEVATEDADQDPTAVSGAERRGGTAPLWTGPSTGVEAELVTRSGTQPVDVQIDLVDPGESEADSTLGAADITATAHAATTMPPVHSRAQWGADESLRTWGPEYAATLKAATLHHTADTNNYTADQVPAMLRSIYRYHSVSRGWGDIGYNVLVDKFGRLWEGRSGGLATTVVGAHAGGFNTSTTGVSLLGNYDQVPVPQVAVDAVAAFISWKFALFGIDPQGRVTLTSGGGGTAKYAAGTRVSLPTVFGHRDVGNTSCPGQYGYARLGGIRSAVTAAMATRPPATIAERYAGDATLRVTLGTPVGPEQRSGDVTWQAYTAGQMYSSSATGIRELHGDILRAYLTAGGLAALGAPLTDEVVTPDGVGRYNHFAKGASIYWTPSTASQLVSADLKPGWQRSGWEAGPLGYPVSLESAVPGGRVQAFQRGTVYWSSATGAHAVHGAIATRLATSGGVEAVGFPISGELATPDTVGRYNHFATGVSIYWTPSTGAQLVGAEVRKAWQLTGWESGPLGYPVAAETAVAGGQVQAFQRGSVYRSAATGAHEVHGVIAARLAAAGGVAALGLPTSGQITTPDRVGRYNHFAKGGSIYWTPSTGAQVVGAEVRREWQRTGWEAGTLGYPVAPETEVAGGRVQAFQRGSVYWSTASGAHEVHGVIASRLAAAGGVAELGLPISGEITTPDRVGRYNHFTKGASIYWTPGTGAHTVSGDVRARWAALGWEAGPLGYPTVDPVQLPGGGTLVQFASGRIYSDDATGAHEIYGAILASYLAGGGHTSSLGMPTSGEYAVAGGRRTDFEHGSLVFSAVSGAVARTAR